MRPPGGGHHPARQLPEGVTIFHAGTAPGAAACSGAGGRVLNVTAVASSAGRSGSGVRRRRRSGTRARSTAATSAGAKRRGSPGSARAHRRYIPGRSAAPRARTIRDIRPALLGRRFDRLSATRTCARRRPAPSRCAGSPGRPCTKCPGAPNAVLDLGTAARGAARMTGLSRLLHTSPHWPATIVGMPSCAQLDDGRGWYRDVRRLGTLLLPRPSRVGALRPRDRLSRSTRLHPEAGTVLAARQAVKKVIMDQTPGRRREHLRQQALYAAGIDPPRRRAAHAGGSPPAACGDPAHPSGGDPLQRYHGTRLSHRHRRGNFQPSSGLWPRGVVSPVRHPVTGTHTIDARITVFCHRCQS
jgi:hypothetical protein